MLNLGIFTYLAPTQGIVSEKMAKEKLFGKEREALWKYKNHAGVVSLAGA